jgi:nitrate/nitrite transport system ATP-binding protein
MTSVTDMTPEARTAPAATVPAISLRGITKSYAGADGGVTQVLADLDLDVAIGEFVAVLGFSGSGKTTLVSAIAGLIEPNAGEVEVDGRPVASSPGGTGCGVVFQSYSLFPWLTVEGNVRLAVDAVHRGLDREARSKLTDATIELVGLAHARDRKTAQLSGGMRQRVAVARALAMKSDILLLDEPLSALDALTRAKLQDEIERIRAQERRTILLVTNDVDEALLLADRVAVLEPGPGAKIAATYAVDLPRPRRRAELNHDLAYTVLRNQIVACLDGLKLDQPSAVDAPDVELPDVAPRDLRPPAVQRAQSDSFSPKRYVELAGLTKTFQTPNGPLTVVDAVDLRLDRGEFVSLIGHSGCGKSTVLSMIAGLSTTTGGWVALDGHTVDAAGPDKAMVFQAPSLLPWLTARQNVALGVERVYPHASKRERGAIVEYYLSRVGLADAMDKPASDLSSGMRQRVGLARAFALSPKVLLLDEPFGMLDSLTRWDLQDVLLEVWDRSKVTTICVTHDVDEAILLADRVVMMTNGPRAKIGRVLDIEFERPRDRRALLEDPLFYEYREQVLAFLDEYEHGERSDAA